MEIILSKQCESLTGSLGRGFGYFIQRRRGKKEKPRFFSQRSKHQVPHDGHLRFILTFFGDDKSPAKEGEFYLTLSEVQHFSLYAGYDLTKD